MKVIQCAAIILLWFFHFATIEAQTVIIVGAGISGILAAKTLHQNGIADFLILEADERIGGRLLKKDFQGHTVELGAGSISTGGPIGSVLVDIANKINLKTYTSGFDDISSYTYDQEGELYQPNMVKEIILHSRTVADRCKEYSEILSKPSSYAEDLDTSILAAQEFYQRVPATPLEMVIDFYYNDYQDGEPPKYTSMKHTYPRYEAEDFGETTHFVRDERGFESIAHDIAGKFLLTANGVITDRRLKLGTAVTEIQHIRGGVAIITKDGVYNSRFVIVSVSIGVLQANLIKFSPELPPLQRIAISDFRMAAYTQIFLKFPSTFWPVGPGTEVFLYADKNRGFYPLWRHLSNQFHGSNILTVTVTDAEAKRIESQSEENTKMEIMIVLRKIFKDHFVPYPQEILVPKWSTNKLYMGSFANWPSRFSQKSHDLLREPYGPIYFTGEHLSSRYIGSVIGAYYAGIRTAEDVTKQLNR